MRRGRVRKYDNKRKVIIKKRRKRKQSRMRRFS